MNVETKTKLDRSTYPCRAAWMVVGGATYSGIIMARGPDYIEVDSKQRGIYRQVDADVIEVSFAALESTAD